jgi:hypothetical protein
MHLAPEYLKMVRTSTERPGGIPALAHKHIRLRLSGRQDFRTPPEASQTADGARRSLNPEVDARIVNRKVNGAQVGPWTPSPTLARLRTPVSKTEEFFSLFVPL